MHPERRSITKYLADDGCIHIPVDNGILIVLEGDASVHIETAVDAHFPNIHPNCYAPAGLTDVDLLKGGGSGTAVFSGQDPQFGSLVLKHAGPKDTLEVFSLVKIADELIQRRSFAPDASAFLKQRIPEFQYAYLSPVHLRDRKKERWMTIRKNLRYLITHLSRLSSAPSNASLASTESTTSLSSDTNDDNDVGSTNVAGDAPVLRLAESKYGGLSFPELEPRLSLSADKSKLRSLLIRPIPESCETTVPAFIIANGCVDICVPGLRKDGSVRHGVSFLDAFAKEFSMQQHKNRWKVTLAQKTIGGPTSENGAVVMTSGRLKGPLLKTLIKEFTKVMQSLKEVTNDHERHILHELRTELSGIRESMDVTTVSKELDAYVGGCILKNYHPREGRFIKLRKYGKLFREKADNLFLSDDEVPPARLLGLMLERGSDIGRVFVEPPPGQCCALDIAEDHWLTVIEYAAALDDVPAATECIWTCGLTDAGLHNCFISDDRGLELFDLGEPKLIPQPAFLTKFLMSIFHVYGMEDNSEKAGGTGWVHRFHIAKDGRLELEKGMQVKIDYMFQVYQDATDSFVATLFNGQEKVRRLLASYAVLQLLSDAGFCLNR
ncbi:hypothetical protein MPSEU_000242600 [Mayamaea pseudoterrestris]|nr:hypothetical protein MPSEU_000242600 [Mayamaea pseudoterrestris]